MRGWRAALTLLPALAGCTSPPPRIAVVGSSEAIAAARLAVHDVNRGGGIEGRRLELSIRLESGSPQASIAIAQELADDPALLGVVGHNGSASSLAASQVYNPAGLTQVAPTTSTPLFGRAGRFSFALVPNDARQAAFLARQLDLAPGARVAVVHGNDDYGRALRTELHRCLLAGGIAPPLDYAMGVPADTAELAGLKGALERFRPHVLVWIGQPSALALTLPELRRALPTLRVFGSDAFDAPFTYGPGHAALVGMRFVRFTDPFGGGTRLRALARRYRAATGLELTYEPLFTYDAVMLLAQGLRRGARTRAQLYARVSALAADGFDAVEGPLRLDGQAAAERSYLLGEVTPAGVRALPLR